MDSGRAWVIAGASFLVLALGGGSHYITVVALKPIAAEFDWPRTVPALCYSLSMFGMGLGGIFMGRWSDRVGVALPVGLGVCMIAAGAWLASGSQDKWQLFFAHGVLIGLLGNAALFAPLVANTSRWFERRRGIAVAVVASGQTVGGAVWPPIFRYYIDTHGWRDAYSWFALFVLLGALPWAWLLRGRPPRTSSESLYEASQVEADRVLGLPSTFVLALLCCAIIGCCVAMAMPMVHLVAHATDLGYSTLRAAQLLSVLLGAAVVSRLLWGLMADRIGGLRTLFAGSLCQVVCLAAFSVVDGLAGLYVVAALFGLGFGGIVPCYTLIIREYFPRSGTGRRVGIVLFFGTIGMALGGWLGAYIFDLGTAYSTAFLVGVAFNVGNLLIVGFLLKRRTRASAFALAGAG